MAAQTAGPPPKAGSGKTVKKAAAASPQFSLRTKARRQHHRIEIYGPGGIGKSTLAWMMTDAGREVLFIDLEQSAGLLGFTCVDEGVDTLDDLITLLRSPLLDEFDTVVVDSVTKVEEMCVAAVLESVPTESGTVATSIESYGYGKGTVYLYEAFVRFMAEVDRLFERGKNVVLIAHEAIISTPNPSGEDFLRFVPRLSSPKSGRNSIRSLAFEWADHVLFLGWDVMASKEGKAVGGGSRTIYTQEQAHFAAKSRTLAGARPFAKGDSSIWKELFNVGEEA